MNALFMMVQSPHLCWPAAGEIDFIESWGGLNKNQVRGWAGILDLTFHCKRSGKGFWRLSRTKLACYIIFHWGFHEFNLEHLIVEVSITCMTSTFSRLRIKRNVGGGLCIKQHTWPGCVLVKPLIHPIKCRWYSAWVACGMSEWLYVKVIVLGVSYWWLVLCAEALTNLLILNVQCVPGATHYLWLVRSPSVALRTEKCLSPLFIGTTVPGPIIP